MHCVHSTFKIIFLTDLFEKLKRRLWQVNNLVKFKASSLFLILYENKLFQNEKANRLSDLIYKNGLDSLGSHFIFGNLQEKHNLWSFI